MAMIEMIEVIHFNETWQWNTKARGNCHGSLIVVAATTQVDLTIEVDWMVEVDWLDEADWLVEADWLDEADIVEDDEPLKVVRKCIEL